MRVRRSSHASDAGGKKMEGRVASQEPEYFKPNAAEKKVS